jgi:hypothetical protein
MLALSGVYRAARNPTDFADHPLQTLAGIATFSERADWHTLATAREAVVTRFNEYIPANSQGHQTPARISFDVPPSGEYLSENQAGGPAVRIYPFQRAFTSTHVAIHEFCHCYTHPQFWKTVAASPHQVNLYEGITEHVADKFPTGLFSRGTAYDSQKLSNGKTLTQAAAELEKAVGEPTLLRALFKGDALALRQVSQAAVAVFPKKSSAATWRAIESAVANGSAQLLAECFVGASLLHEGKVPEILNPKTKRIASAHRYRPVHRFSDNTPQQQKNLRLQAKRLRSEIGETKFDQAFYNFDREATQQALTTLQRKLQDHWPTVLS